VSALPPRLKSVIWVQAFLRRCSGQGLYGAVLHKGAEEAGSIFVVINHLDGTYELLGPPPGPAIDENGDRRFARETSTPCDWPEARRKIDQKRKYDPDIWVVEIEDRTSLAGLTPE
jgi:hypothetical protein